MHVTVLQNFVEGPGLHLPFGKEAVSIVGEGSRAGIVERHEIGG